MILTYVKVGLWGSGENVIFCTIPHPTTQHDIAYVGDVMSHRVRLLMQEKQPWRLETTQELEERLAKEYKARGGTFESLVAETFAKLSSQGKNGKRRLSGVSWGEEPSHTRKPSGEDGF